MRSSVFLLLLLPTLLAPIMVERILAVVNGRPVVFSEVTLLAKVKHLDEKAALEAFIDQRLMGEEALKVPQASVTPEEETALYKDLVTRIGGLPEDFSEKDLRAFVRREAVVLKYTNFRFRSEVRISDEDLRKAYTEEYGKMEPPPGFLTVVDRLREKLEDARVSEQVEAWVKELRTAAEIRYNRTS